MLRGMSINVQLAYGIPNTAGACGMKSISGNIPFKKSNKGSAVTVS